MDPYTIDLDAAQVARREATQDYLPVRLRGETFRLPVELPVDALAPLLPVMSDKSLWVVVREAFDRATGGDAGDRADTVGVMLDLMITRPDLPVALVDAARQVLVSLVCDCGHPAGHGDGCQWLRFWACRPSVHDLRALASGLARCYGVGLGEAPASPGPSTGSGTGSTPTSNPTTGSTPAPSGDGQVRRKAS